MSQHPLAKAVVDYAHQNGARKVDVSNFQSVTGKGAYAEIDGVTDLYRQPKLGTGTFFIARDDVATSGIAATTRKVCHGDCHWDSV